MNNKNKFLSYIPFCLLILVCIFSLFPKVQNVNGVNMNGVNAADTAWVLTATALVLIMTPGLAFFYGGMVQKKNVISTMLQTFVCMAVITIVWMVCGFSLCFGESIHGVIGNPLTFFMFKDVSEAGPWKLAPTIPFLLFAFYQLKFAIIAPALITGALAERVRFISYVLFIVLFCLFIYAPLAHATWHPEGVLYKLGVLDFAGGTVVHMSAGWAALAGAIFLKNRSQSAVHKPARITYVILGTGLLWFGWIGFNAGSAFGANDLAITALSTTGVASASAAFTWMIFDAVRGRLPSAMGMCIGAVVGLVAITPAAGFVSIPHAFIIGFISSLVSNLMLTMPSKINIDDTLDVFPSHGIGGMVGMILTGVFASQKINPANTTGNGLFFGETKLFLIHIAVLLAVSIFVFCGTWILLWITNKISPLRVSEDAEKQGLDLSQHAEFL